MAGARTPPRASVSVVGSKLETSNVCSPPRSAGSTSKSSSSSVGTLSGARLASSSSGSSSKPDSRPASARSTGGGKSASSRSRSHTVLLPAQSCATFLLTPLHPPGTHLPSEFALMDGDSSEPERPRRSSSSPQLLRSRARSDSASSSASLTATEDTYSYAYERMSASTSRFPMAYPTSWAYPPAHGPAPADLGASSPSGESETESEEEQDGMIFVTHGSSSSLNSGLRSRRNIHRRREEDGIRMVTTARGQPCAGETETELDELPARLPTSRNIPDSPPLISLPIDIIVYYLFQCCRFLSVVPSVFGTLYNIHHAYHPPPDANPRNTRIDYVVCGIWAILTGFQCLALTTGLLSRWKAYYATLSTIIRLVALQAICWPATHLTLKFFDYSKRPVVCWALIGTTTCISRSVQIWVTSNLYMPVSNGDGRVLRGEGRLGPRRWDWAEVGVKCVFPAGVLYFITAWALILKNELNYC